MHSTPTTFRSKLSPYEQLFNWAIYERNSFVPVQVARFKYNDANITNVLEQSLLILQNRYQILSIRINEKNEYEQMEQSRARELLLKHHFRVIDKYNTQMNTTDDELWKKVFDQELHKTGKQLFGDLLWNVTLVYDSSSTIEMNELIMTIHHSVADGQSFTVLLNEIFEIMIDISEGNSIDTDVFHPLSEPIESLVSQVLPDDLAASNDTASSRTLLEYPIEYCSDRHQRLSFINLGRDKSDKLLKLCKERGLTVNSTICAAIALSGYKHVHLEKFGTPSNAFCDIYISVSQRNNCTPVIPQDQVGLFYNGFSAKVYPDIDCQSFDSTALCKLGHCLQNQIQQFVRDRNSMHISLSENWFQNVSGFMGTTEPQSGRLNHFNVSNRGKLDHLFPRLLLHKSNFIIQLTEIYVATSQWKMGNFISIHVMSLNNQIMLTIASIDPLLSNEKHNQIVKEFESSLMSL